MISIIVKRSFSKYKEIDRVINSRLKKVDKVPSEPMIRFKPKSNSFYEAHGSIKPALDKAYNITEPSEVPHFMHKAPLELSPIYNKVTPTGGKFSKIAIWGPTNSGKSQLLNSLIGREISAVSNKAFTSDSVIKGIKTDVNLKTQLLFYDLPGFSISHKIKTSKEYSNMASKTFQDEGISKLLFVVDSNKMPSSQLAKTLEEIHSNFFNKFSCLLLMNKMDLCFNRRKLMDMISYYEGIINFEKKFFISADTGFGINDVTNYLIQESLPGTWLFEPEIKAHMSELDIAQELVKSCIYNRYFKEFPYELEFEIIEFLIRSDCVQVHVKLNCERRLHKSIIIGKDGKNLTVLRTYIENHLSKSYAKKVEVRLTVASGLKNQAEFVVNEDDERHEAISEIAILRKKKSINAILPKKNKN
jgi:GTP-binding protein Era